MKSTRPVLFVCLPPPPPMHCARESLNHFPVRWNERISTRWPYSWSSGSGCSCWGRRPGPGPEHILSLCRGLARHNVLTSRLTAKVLGLRSQILVLRGWTTVRNAWSKLITLKEEFYLASSSRRPFSEYNKSWDLGKSDGIAQGYISSIDHWSDL